MAKMDGVRFGLPRIVVKANFPQIKKKDQFKAISLENLCLIDPSKDILRKSKQNTEL